jgi:F-type H+-transporting ATPase subunit a
MEISLAAEPIIKLGQLVITNSLLTTWLVMVFLVVVALAVSRRISLVPKGLQNIIEALVEFLFNTIRDITGSEKTAHRYFSLLATFFIFILASNLAGLLPGFGSLGLMENGKLVHLFRAPSSDLTTTLALAIISVISTQIFGIAALGALKYLKKFFSFKGPVEFFVGILEFLSEITKIISFSFRLFGNIFAGEVMLIVLTFLVPYLLPLPFYGLEIFVGFIQAFVFMALTTAFLKIATTEMEH